MKPIFRLPKNAFISTFGIENLIIKNHEVMHTFGMFYWMLYVERHGQWGVIMPQLLSQGFQLGTVIEQCISDLQDQKKLVATMRYIGLEGETHCKEFISSVQGKKFAETIIKKIQKCKNWEQLYCIIVEMIDSAEKIKNNGGIKL